MQFDTSMIGTMNAGLAFGIFFMMFVVLFVAYTRKRNVVVRRHNERVIVKTSYSRNMLVMAIFFLFLTFIATALLTNYFVSATEDDLSYQQDKLKNDLEQRLKDSILTIDLMAAQSEVNHVQLDSMRAELEDGLTRLHSQGSSRKQTKIVYITPGGY